MMVKKYILLSAIAYLIFVIYGSLVPLQYHYLPLDVAWHQFKSIHYLTLGIHSRADWVANGLLFIPLVFLWSGVFWPRTNSQRVVSSVLILVTAIFLSLSIEFTQLYFPQRTVSLNDIIAESLGALVGILIWWRFHPVFLDWCQHWFQEYQTANRWRAILHLYIFLLIAYSIIPLDLTLSPVELYHKWNEGRIFLLPFSGFKGNPVEVAYELFSDIIIWIPLAIFWNKEQSLSPANTVARVVLTALVIEFLQLFVYSRVTDISDIFTALLGGIAGTFISKHFVNVTEQGAHYQQNTNKLLYRLSGHWLFYGLALYFIWNLILIVALWYPFHFNLDSSSIKAQINGFFSVPFYRYYYSSEYHALTELLRKISLFVPLGLAVSLIVNGFKNKPTNSFETVILFICLGNIVLLEFSQVIVEGKYADITDNFLEALGCLAGYWLGQSWFKLSKSAQSDPAEPVQTQKNIKGVVFSWKSLSIGAVISSLFLLLIIQSTSIPYNIRELFAGSWPLLNTLGFTLILFWVFVFPLYYISQYQGGQTAPPPFFFSKHIALHTITTWILVRIFLPMESIYDIIGTPILNIPSEIELLLRFSILFALFSYIASGSALITLRLIQSRPRLILYINYLLFAVIIFPLAWWAIVDQAATDNLTELLYNNGHSIQIVAIIAYLYLLTLSIYLLTSLKIRHTLRYTSLIILFVSIGFPLGFDLVSTGTESLIFKYGQTFSALQFLLSPDRAHLIAGEQLHSRFYIMHLGLIMAGLFPLLIAIKPLYKKQPEKQGNGDLSPINNEDSLK